MKKDGEYYNQLETFSKGMWEILMYLLQSDYHRVIAPMLRDKGVDLADGYKFGFGK